MTRIAFISPTGYGNLGDAAIIDSLVHAIRRRQPEAEIVGFTMVPSDTTARHGVRAFTCSGVSIPRYKMREAPPAPAGVETPGSMPVSTGGRRLLGRVPGIRKAYGLVRAAVAERRHQRVSAERVRGFDLVVVAGGGQLDGFWGGPFGHPWTLRRWASIASAVGARFVILSVGTGTLSPLGSRFVRRALALASYRSFRDRRSRELAGAPALTRDDPVVPDLAYALPVTPPAVGRPALAVGVSPMAYADPRVWPAPDLARYRRHVEGLAALTVRLVRAGTEVVVFTTDAPDRLSLAEMLEVVRAELRPVERGRIRVPRVDGVADLMRAVAECEVVVAARLHGVVLSHVAGRPALAISHERKVRTAMEGMGHERYCLEIDGFDPDVAWDRLVELRARRAELSGDVRRKVEDYRRQVEEQYDRTFGSAA